MSGKALIKEIMESEEFREKPPVLIDIGASGKLHECWKPIAPYSICIAFDADTREFNPLASEKSGYKKLILFNSIVSDTETEDADFFLTQNPYCSSTLPPDLEKLSPWIFQSLFQIKEKSKLKNISLRKALQTADLNYVDWFKTDSQGTDLRLFLSLDLKMRSKIKAAEFEPGIIDSYQGEDKLHKVFSEMEQLPFYLSDMKVCGTNRISPDTVKKYFPDNKSLTSTCLAFKQSPCWAELLYLNDFSGKEDFDERDSLLLALISLLNFQYGAALEIADHGFRKYHTTIFQKIITFCMKKINGGTRLCLKNRIKNKMFRLMERYL